MSSDAFQLLMADGEDGEPYLDQGAPREQAAAEGTPQPAHQEAFLADISARASDLGKQRWGVFYPDTPAGRRLCRILRPLVKHRAEEQGASALLVPVPPGLRTEDAARWHKGVYPETWRHMEHRRPRYACILGDLDQVSLATQQVLSIDHLPGRIACAEEEGYEAYVDKVLDWEGRPDTAPPKMVFYTVRDGTTATQAGHQHLVQPCVSHCHDVWQEERHSFPVSALEMAGHDDAPDAHDFLSRTGGEDPTVLLTVSHGSGPPRRRPWTPAQARERQGAMRFGREGTLMPSDIADRRFLPGGFWFYFACFGAGTPTRSAYHHWLTLLQEGELPGLKDLRSVLKGLAPGGAFTSGLAKAALANPNGPLNVMGHLDLAWSYGFDGHKGRPKAARYADLLSRVVRGERAGVVLLDLQNWLHDAANAINDTYDRARAAGVDVAATAEQKRVLGTRWMEHQDLKGYVLLGDPAAKRPEARAPSAAGTGFLAGFARPPAPPPSADVPEVGRAGSCSAPADIVDAPAAPAPKPRAPPAPALAPSGVPPRAPTWARDRTGPTLGDPDLQIVLEFTRSQDASDPYAFSLGRNAYLLRGQGGTYQQAVLDWQGELLEELQAVAEPGADPAIAHSLGQKLRQFLHSAGWPRIERELQDAVEEGRQAVITIRSAAAELFSLPWELLTLQASGRHLGALPGVLVRYEWPGTQTTTPPVLPRPEGGRILLGWSEAGGRVPYKDHTQALTATTQAGFVDFQPARDILPDMTAQGLVGALRSASDAGEPVAILHLLCHGTVTGATFGLALDGEGGRPTALDPGRLREMLAPYAGTLRAVVLCACYGGNAGELSNHLGSVAQTLHRAGIQAVISSRFPFSTSGSAHFTRAFYERLLVEPSSLETAFLQARAALVDQPRTLDWASLQLYAREADGADNRPIVFRPYRGLLAFQPSHARFFFGRDRERQSILKALETLTKKGRPRFLVVAGASGTGKSSVVFAGAVPDLLGDTATARAAEQERVNAMLAQLKSSLGGLGDDAIAAALATLSQAGGDGDDNPITGPWELARTRPGNDPKKNLSAALASRRDPKGRLLLIIDQFEELFTLASEEQREDFARRLWSLSRIPDSGVSILITIRVDFLGHCGDVVLDESGLRLDRVAYDENHRVFVAQMGMVELRAAIMAPARKVGLQLDPGLAERMLEEVEGEPGALPVLSYTLDLLWSRRDGDRLTQAAYEALGGVVGALHRKADALLSDMDEAHRHQSRRLLVQLVRVREDGGLDTRRRVAIERMKPGRAEDIARFETALAAFIDARLLVRGEEGGVATLEVAHEALIRKWDRLRDWVMEDRDKLQELQELRSWVSQCQQYKTVLAGDQLVKATATQSRYAEDLDTPTLDLVRKSQWAVRRREIAIRAVALVSLAAAFCFAGLGIFGYNKAEEAQYEKGVAENKAEQAAIATGIAHKEKLKATAAMEEAQIARDEAVRALADAEAARGEAMAAKGEAEQQGQ